MSKMIQTLEQKEVQVGDDVYLLEAFPAKFGLTIMEEMLKGENFSTSRMVDILLRSVSYQGRLFTEQTFNKHFSRKYKEVAELFNEVLVFNFGETLDNPLEDETLEESGTSEE